VQPQDASAFTIFAQSEDRTGYARATLAPQIGMTAPVPPMDPRPILSMVDMGMAMGNMPGMNMGTGGAEQKQTGAAMENMPGMKMGDMPGMKMGTAPPAPSATPGMKMNDMPGMKMGDDMSGMDTGNMPAMKGKPKPSAARGPLSMPFPQPGPETTGLSAPSTTEKPIAPKPVALREGPQVDNVADAPKERLSEPGNGLNGNGRRVLTYTDLRARYRAVDPRPSRDIEIH
jgi:hypothetical protein